MIAVVLIVVGCALLLYAMALSYYAAMGGLYTLRAWSLLKRRCLRHEESVYRQKEYR